MNLDAIFDLIRAAVLLGILIATIRLIISKKDSIREIFFALAIVSILLSDFYWLAYDTLRPDIRMPFAANELCEWATFLLLGACLTSRYSLKFRWNKLQLICTTLFVAGNAALWYGWSGEWLQDIMTGLSFGYFLLTVITLLKQEEAYKPYQWAHLGLDCLILLSAQATIFFVPEPYKRPIDLCCYGILFATAIAFIICAIISLKKDKKPAKSVSHAFAAFAWIVVTMYQSNSYFYHAAMLLSALCFVLMFLSLKKEVAVE